MTPPGRELFSRAALYRADIPAWSPLESRWRHVSGPHRRRLPVIHPALSRLIFVNAPGGEFWQIVARLRLIGIVGEVLIRDRAPLRIAGPELAAFVSRFDNSLSPDTLQRDMRSRGEFREGDTVEVIGGPFRQTQGPVQTIDPHAGTATVLAAIFGGIRPVAVPIQLLVRQG